MCQPKKERERDLCYMTVTKTHKNSFFKAAFLITFLQKGFNFIFSNFSIKKSVASSGYKSEGTHSYAHASEARIKRETHFKSSSINAHQ